MVQQRVVHQVALPWAVVRGSGARCALFELSNPPSFEAEARLPIHRSWHRKLLRAAAPGQNKPVARGEERAGRMALRAFFCDAVSARASICACKAFNTEERVGSIGSSFKRTTRDSRTESRRAWRDDQRPFNKLCPGKFLLQFEARNTSHSPRSERMVQASLLQSGSEKTATSYT